MTLSCKNFDSCETAAVPGSESGPCFAALRFPWPRPFPCRWFPDTHGVSDRAGPACTSPWRCPPCCFPLFSTASAPWSFNFSRLNTQLASAPVNASPAPSRVTTHDSGSSWAANPSTYGSFIHYHLPASRRTETVRSRPLSLRQSPPSQQSPRPFGTAEKPRKPGLLRTKLLTVASAKNAVLVSLSLVVSKAPDFAILVRNFKRLILNGYSARRTRTFRIPPVGASGSQIETRC